MLAFLTILALGAAGYYYRDQVTAAALKAYAKYVDPSKDPTK